MVKKNGQREPFDPQKLAKGLSRACEKRPVSAQQISSLVEQIISKVTEEYPDEVQGEFIGECVMDLLQHVDQVAYVRFASVYRQFKDVSQFREELDKLLKG